MGNNFKRRGEGERLAAWFEEQMQNDASQFFDLNVYIDLIEHYLQLDNNNKALEVCHIGTEQYPYSSELLGATGVSI